MIPKEKRLAWRALADAATAQPWVAELDMFSTEEGIVACVSDAKNDMIIRLETGLYIPSPADGATARGEVQWTAADSERRDAQWRLARTGQELRDMEFVAAAREAVPALDDEVQRLEDRLAKVNESIRSLRDMAAAAVGMGLPRGEIVRRLGWAFDAMIAEADEAAQASENQFRDTTRFRVLEGDPAVELITKKESS